MSQMLHRKEVSHIATTSHKVTINSDVLKRHLIDHLNLDPNLNWYIEWQDDDDNEREEAIILRARVELKPE